MRFAMSILSCMLLATANANASTTVSLGGPPGSAGGTCIGTYNALVKFPGCSNSISVNETFVISSLTSVPPFSAQGGATLSKFAFSEHHFANGSCSIVPGTSSDLSLAFGATLSSPTTANFAMKAVNGAQLGGTFSQSVGGKLSGTFSGNVLGPEVQGAFNCLLQDAPLTGAVPLAITRSGTGSGNVVSAPAGIDCGLTCGASFTKGTNLVLTAKPDAGSYFAGWSGACSGRATCGVTINEATGVKASFMTIPFPVANTGTVSTTTVSLNTAITFKTADIGKRGSVFVTARIPRAALLKALQSSGNLSTMQAMDTAETSSTVLIQQTASGWQTVVDGQLVPYASGVLGETVASQTILYTTDTSTLEGAEFCVGYGTSAAEMVASGNMVPVASVPATTSTGSVTESCVIEGSSTASVAPLTGLWWNANESGWGMSITQRTSTIFLAWYTYDATGKPVWYVMSSCPVVGSACSGEIYSVTGGTSLLVPWNGAAKVVLQAGSGSLSFTDNDNAVFNYTLNGVAGQRSITRQPIASGTAQPTIDYSALWWNPSESGWGVSIAQQYATLFVALYSYDANGAPYWYVASSCPIVGTSCTGDLYKVSGGTSPSVPWNGTAKSVSKVGTVSLSFSDDSNGSMSYTIDGVSASRTITKQLF
ncbi:hypothetical protein BH11PSE11_BH11PSE11_15750 [soil metagenome]